MEMNQDVRTRVAFDEIIDESSRAVLDMLFANVGQGTIEVDCGRLARINSEGVRLLSKALKVVAGKGVKLVFQRCTPSLIEHVNTYDGFLSGGTVESIMAPYMCRKCGKATSVYMTCEAVVEQGLQPQPVPCESCGGSATFDDYPDFYFGFLRARVKESK
jgi:eukaryotic-like serine/threonine-protein kinase